MLFNEDLYDSSKSSYNLIMDYDAGGRLSLSPRAT
jgi:hypothetical protein